MNDKAIAVAVLDVGSPKKGNIGWYMRPAPHESPTDRDEQRCLDALISKVAERLKSGPVALGFEAPMYVPLRGEWRRLTERRQGEENKAWSAGAGAAVLASGLAICPYVLKSLRTNFPNNKMAFLSWTEFDHHADGLFLFEAFVTSQSKRFRELKENNNEHIAAAQAAVERFCEKIREPPPQSDLRDSNEKYFNLLGAALLRTDWSCDLDLLKQPCIVVKAE